MGPAQVGPRAHTEPLAEAQVVEFGGCVNRLLPSCKFVLQPYCSSASGTHVVCAATLYRALGVKHSRTATIEGARKDSIHQARGLTHGPDVHRGFPPAETQSWKVRRSGTCCLIQRARAGILCAPARQGGHDPGFPPTLGPKGPQRLRTGPSPLLTPGPGLHPFSAALLL